MAEKMNILVVDDEPQMRLAMQAVLERLQHRVTLAANGRQALSALEEQRFELIISDMKMPELDGEALLAECRTNYPSIPFVMITAYGTIGQAVTAMKQGAYDFITKPFSAEDLETVLGRLRLGAGQIRSQKPSIVRDSRAILTNDPGFRRVIEIATTVAKSSASVLIQGESGTGKELIARLIHSSSGVSKGPFVAVNCAALPETLLESELFGHEKGAFTGAQSAKPGKFELANEGTILLDEVSEMAVSLQAKLLRVLQEREVDRVGGSKPIPLQVRVIATTNRNLAATVAKGEFREDLYYRLNVIPLVLPPLRERRSDIRLLVNHFIKKFSPNQMRISAEVLEKLEQYEWPGNIRELENTCERAVLLARSTEIQFEDFLLHGSAGSISSSPSVDNYLKLHPGLSVAEAERRLIFETLRATENNKTKAAELLGISIRTLRNKLNEYDSLPS